MEKEEMTSYDYSYKFNKNNLARMKKVSEMLKIAKCLSIPVSIGSVYAIFDNLIDCYKVKDTMTQSDYSESGIRYMIFSALFLSSLYTINKSNEKKAEYAYKKRMQLVKRTKTAVEASRKEARDYVAFGYDVQARVR